VGPRAGLDVCEKPRPYRDSNPGPSRPKPVAIPVELSQESSTLLRASFCNYYNKSERAVVNNIASQKFETPGLNRRLKCTVLKSVL
jgi:hypothetical protein